MRVIVIGTRGFPYIQGGIETHCQGLYPELVKLGCEVTVIRRTPYLNESNSEKDFEGVKFKDVWAPRKKSLEAIVHTLLGVVYARLKNPDILHFHGIGPSLFVPFARILGLKVVATTQGPDYDRQKWGKLAKFVLRLGEHLGTKYANELIVVSEVINQITKKNYARHDAHLIYNGVHLPTKSNKEDYINALGLKKNKYIIAVARFVEEKGFHYLMDAFIELENLEYKLVLVGDSDHPSDYASNLKRKAFENGIITTGFIKGEKLNQIFSHARLFVLPSFHEGLSLALLEALSYDLDVLASDIPANICSPLPDNSFFKVGDKEDLKLQLKLKLDNPVFNYQHDLKNYNWERIGKQTLHVYEKTVKIKD